MGVMRFLVHPSDAMTDWPEVHRGYMSGLDTSVWPCRIEVDRNEVLVRRQVSDSGKLHVPWPVSGFGRPTLSTASLPERTEPYLLPVELARGKIVQVRNQQATWCEAGLQLPPTFSAELRSAQKLFASAVAGSSDPAAACARANQALIHACAAAEQLTQAYVQQRLIVRHRQYPQLPTLLGCKIGGAPLPGEVESKFLAAFNSAAIPIEWRKVEPKEGEYHWDAFDAQVAWCEQHGLHMRGGPLLDLSPKGLPEWLWNWVHDFWNLQSFVCDFVETAITRYAGRMRMWEVAARANSGGALALNEEQRLTLAAKAIEVARQSDPESQFMIRIDQPWGEYQARGQHKLSPIQFTDALIRAGLGLTAINLEVPVGYTPRVSGLRDLLDFSRLIDTWSGLGIPLRVTLCFPSSRAADPFVDSDLEVDHDLWVRGWTENSQAEWIDQYVPLLMAKPAVMGIFWGQFHDGMPHRFPNGGLVESDGHSKPALDRLMALKKKYWSNEV